MKKTVFLFLLLSLGMASMEAQVALERVTSGPIASDLGYSFGHSWGDYNSDGLPDLLVNNLIAGQKNFLYRNDGSGNFTRISNLPITTGGPTTSSAWADYDNDGDQDLFAANGGTIGSALNFLYNNQGMGQFVSAGSGPMVNQSAPHTVASWIDVDLDAWPDLFVGKAGGANAIYRNLGNGNFFRIPLADNGGSWGVGFADYDNDGDMDLYLANWGKPNYFYRNDGNANFTRLFNRPEVMGSANSVGASWGDYDHDGNLDLFIANSGAADRLFHNDGNGSFTEITGNVITNHNDNSEGSCWADIDNDGDLDLLVSGGGNVASGRNFLYLGDGKGNFSRQDTGEFVTLSSRYEGLSCIDMDRDGFLDVFLSNYQNQSNRLYHNAGNSNHWIRITLEGSISNRDAIGARVWIVAEIGGQKVRQLLELGGHSGHVAQPPRELHVGLGDALVADSLIIRWPSGRTESFAALAADQAWHVHEGRGGPTALEGNVRIAKLFAYPNPARGTVYFKYELLRPEKVSFELLDLKGNRVFHQASQQQSGGTHHLRQDVSTLASGIYLYRFQVGKRILGGRILLMK